MKTKEKILLYLKNEYRKLEYKYVMIPTLAFILIGLAYNEYSIYTVENCDYEIVSCKVYDVTFAIKPPSYGISYKYTLGDIGDEDYDTEPNIYKPEIKNFLLGKNIPLLICKDKPKYQEILLAPEDFEVRNLPYPDSLRIYMEYLK